MTESERLDCGSRCGLQRVTAEGGLWCGVTSMHTYTRPYPRPLAPFTPTRLPYERGLAAHVGPCDDLEPAVAAPHDAVVLDEVHAVLRLHAWVTGAPQLQLPRVRVHHLRAAHTGQRTQASGRARVCLLTR